MSQQRMVNSSYIALIVLELSAQFSVMMVNPIVSNFSVSMGTAVSFAGFLFGLQYLIALLLRPVSNILFAHIAKHKLLMFATVLYFLASFVCSFVPAVGLLALSRVLIGVAFVFKTALVVAMCASFVPASHVGRAVGYVGLATIVSGAVAPTVGAELSSVLGYTSTYAIAAATSVLCVAACLVIYSNETKRLRRVGAEAGEMASGEKVAGEKASRKGSPRKGGKLTWELVKGELTLSKMFHFKTLPLMFAMLFEGALYGTVWSFVVMVGQMRGVEGISSFFIVYAVVALVSRPFTSSLLDKYGFGVVFLPEGVLMIAGLIIMIFAQNEIVFCIAAAVLALGQGALFPAAQAESVRGLPEEEAAMGANTFSLGPDTGMFIGPMIAGAILEAAGAELMFAFGAACGVLCVVIFYITYLRRKRQENA